MEDFLPAIPYDPETGKQTTLHPITKKWVMMTTREWRLAKLGMDNAKVDDWTLAVLEGPESVVAEGFGIIRHERPGAFLWLLNTYKRWHSVDGTLEGKQKKPTGKEAKEWCYWIGYFYNLDKILVFQDSFVAIQRGLLKNKLESEQLKNESVRLNKAIAARRFEKARRH